jgi:hypothetical protein
VFGVKQTIPLVPVNAFHPFFKQTASKNGSDFQINGNFYRFQISRTMPQPSSKNGEET